MRQRSGFFLIPFSLFLLGTGIGANIREAFYGHIVPGKSGRKKGLHFVKGIAIMEKICEEAARMKEKLFSHNAPLAFSPVLFSLSKEALVF